MTKKKKNKQYGASVLYPLAHDDKVKEVDAFAEIEESIDDEAIAEISKVTSTKEKVVVDALSGVKISSKAPRYNDDIGLNEIINARELAGKKISQLGMSLLSDVLGREVTEEETDRLTSVFDSIGNDNDLNDISTNVMSAALGADVVKRLTSKLANPDKLTIAVRELFTQVYRSYTYVIQYNDDVKTLNNIMSVVNDAIDDVAKSQSLETLKSTEKKLLKALGVLEDKGESPAVKFSITDKDIEEVKEIHDILNRSLLFKSIVDTVDANGRKYNKDLKKINKVREKIETWINDLKTDEHTIYTLPVDARTNITVSSAYDEIVEFVSKIILSDNIKQYFIPMDTVDIEDHCLDQKYITKDSLVKFRTRAIAFVYVLSRTFKLSKLDDESTRRELSYTLDILSKAMHKDYKSDVCNIITYVWMAVE